MQSVLIHISAALLLIALCIAALRWIKRKRAKLDVIAEALRSAGHVPKRNSHVRELERSRTEHDAWMDKVMNERPGIWEEEDRRYGA